jgi:hypothetical protein
LIFLEIRALSRSSSSSHNRSDRGQHRQIIDKPEGTDKKGKETDKGIRRDQINGGAERQEIHR